MSFIATSTTRCTQTQWPDSGLNSYSAFHCQSTDKCQRRYNVVVISLQFAEDLANLLHHPAPKQWREVAERLKIPFDPASQYHPEYDGYVKGESFLTDDLQQSYMT